MKRSYPLIPVHYIAQIESYLANEGIDTQHWLAAANLTKKDVIEDAAMLEYPRYEKLILSAIKLDGNQDIGLRLGARFSINSHGALGFALLNCATIREVLALFSRYLATRTPLLSLESEEQDSGVLISLKELYDIEPIRRCFLEVVVVTVANILKMLTDERPLLLQVNLPYNAPAYSALYPEVLGCDVVFDHAYTRLKLNPSMLDREVQKTDQHSFYQAKAICEAELEKVNQLASFANKIRRLQMNNREKFLSLQQAAEQLNMTARTLHRRLVNESTSFQSILEDVRHTLAKQYLLQNRLNVKQVGYILGYADVANFRRAFKRWQGCSPSEFRNHINQ